MSRNKIEEIKKNAQRLYQWRVEEGNFIVSRGGLDFLIIDSNDVCRLPKSKHLMDLMKRDRNVEGFITYVFNIGITWSKNKLDTQICIWNHADLHYKGLCKNWDIRTYVTLDFNYAKDNILYNLRYPKKTFYPAFICRDKLDVFNAISKHQVYQILKSNAAGSLVEAEQRMINIHNYYEYRNDAYHPVSELVLYKGDVCSIADEPIDSKNILLKKFRSTVSYRVHVSSILNGIDYFKLLDLWAD